MNVQTLRHLTITLCSLACCLALVACGGGSGGGSGDDQVGDGGQPGGDRPGGDPIGDGGDDPEQFPDPPPTDPIRIQDLEIGAVSDGRVTITVRAEEDGHLTAGGTAVDHKGVARMVPAQGVALQAGVESQVDLYLSHVGDYRLNVTVSDGDMPQSRITTITVPGPGRTVSGEIQAEAAASLMAGSEPVTDVLLDWQPHHSLEPMRIDVATVAASDTAFGFDGLATPAPSYRVDIQPTLAP